VEQLDPKRLIVGTTGAKRRENTRSTFQRRCDEPGADNCRRAGDGNVFSPV